MRFTAGNNFIDANTPMSGVRVGKLAELQVDDDEASEPSMKKQQINSVPLVPDAQPVLTPDKRKIAPEFKEESLEFAEESLFQFTL